MRWTAVFSVIWSFPDCGAFPMRRPQLHLSHAAACTALNQIKRLTDQHVKSAEAGEQSGVVGLDASSKRGLQLCRRA
jgi:hypothetical protein